MNAVRVEETHDGIYVARDGEGRVLLAFYAEEDAGWWRACMADGTGRRLWVPGGEATEVAARLLRPK